MKYFKEKMTYFQFIKYLVPSVMTMIFLSFYTTIDGFSYPNMPAPMHWQELIL